MAGGSLGSLTIDLAANISRFERSLTRAERLAEKRSKGITRTFKRMASTIGIAIASFGMVRAVESALEFADAIGKAADRAGIATGKLQEYRFAADQFGVSTQQMDDGLRRFTRRLGVALDGGSFAKDFDALGVAIKDASGGARESGDVLDDVVDAMGRLETQAQKSKAAAQLFGDDTGPQLALLLGQGSEAIDGLTDRARNLGLIMDDALIRNAEKANDELSVLAQVLKIQLTSAIVTLAPHITTIATDLTNLAVGVGKFLDSFDESASVRAVENIARITDEIERAELAVDLARKREDTDGFDFFGLMQSSEQASASLIKLQDDLLAAELKLGTINLRLATRAGDDGGEPINPSTGMTDSELEASNERVLRMFRFLADSRAQIDALQVAQSKKAETEIATFRAQSQQSSVANGIALLRVYGRESKSAAIAALAIEKAFAIAVAIAGTQAAMAKSRIIDPTGVLAGKIAIEGGINVAAIAALGLAQAHQINTQTAGTTPTGAVNDPFAVTNDPFATDASLAGSGTVGTITINVNGVVTEEVLQNLIIPAIQDATNDKDVILFNSDSRQAIELTA